MKLTYHLAAGSVLALASAAGGQQPFTSDSSTSFSLRWIEHGGNNNGVLEPGESAVIAIDVAFTNQNGVASFFPPVGTFGAGTIRGFGTGFLDLHGLATNGGNARTWNLDQASGYGVDPNWQVSEYYGYAANGGSDILDAQFGQFVSTPQSVNTTNPIMTIWSGLWTPESYSPRIVTFSPVGGAFAGPYIGSLWLRLTATMAGTVWVSPGNLAFSPVTIPIVPSPGSVILLGVGAAIGRRRADRGAR